MTKFNEKKPIEKKLAERSDATVNKEGGLAFKPNKMLTLGVTYQAITYEDNFVVKYDGTTTKTDSRLLLHGILSF